MDIFETDHLLVRQFTAGDADSFFLINSNEQVMHYIRPVKSREDSDAFLADNIRQYAEWPGTGRWAVVEKESGSIIGMFSILFLEHDPGKLHIGYALLPTYWGKGYATLLLKAGASYFFAHSSNETLYAITHKENIASEKVLLKCHFTLASRSEKNENLWTLHSTGPGDHS